MSQPLSTRLLTSWSPSSLHPRLHCYPPICRKTSSHALRMESSADFSHVCQAALENSFTLIWEDNHIYRRWDRRQEECGEKRETRKSHKQKSHWTLKEAGDPFLMRGSWPRCGMQRRLEVLRDPITGAALHRGALGGGGLAHLRLLREGVLHPGFGCWELWRKFYYKCCLNGT